MKKLKSSQARYLYRECRFGAELMVKNKNGEVYLVDGGNCGLVKTANCWEDEEYGFDENVFQLSKYNFDFVSWDDKEPLDIWEYLKKNGWVDENGEFVEQ